MAEPIAIRSIRIENFRGFRVEQSIDLAASATVVSGPNGKGKTSFFDAVQWLLLGSLSRLADLASRRSGDYIVNSFAPRGAVATVSAELELDGRLVSLTRSGDYKKSKLTWVDAERSLEGADASHALCMGFLGDPEISLADTVLTSGILQQDVVRAVLQEEPKNRYRHMAALLGLDEIAEFENDAKRRAGEAGERAKHARDQHAVAEQRLRELVANLCVWSTAWCPSPRLQLRARTLRATYTQMQRCSTLVSYRAKVATPSVLGISRAAFAMLLMVSSPERGCLPRKTLPLRAWMRSSLSVSKPKSRSFLGRARRRRRTLTKRSRASKKLSSVRVSSPSLQQRRCLCLASNVPFVVKALHAARLSHTCES